MIENYTEDQFSHNIFVCGC